MTEPYGLNIGRFLADFPEWCITVAPSTVGYSAQRRDGRGRGGGKRITAPTLDELAELLRAEG